MTTNTKIYPKINEDLCTHCGSCFKVCKEKAILENKGTYSISDKDCIQCGHCIKACPVNAISYESDLTNLKENLAKNKKQIIVLSNEVFADMNPESLSFKLQTIGFSKIIDLSFAEYLTLLYYKQSFNKRKTLISSICPVVNTKINKTSKYLQRNSIHIQTPFSIMGEILKKTYPDHIITYVTPCYGAHFHNKENKIFDYTITIKECHELLKSNYKKRRATHDIFYNYIFQNRKKIILQKEYIGYHFIRSKEINKEETQLFHGFNQIQEYITNRNSSSQFIELYYCNDGCLGGPGLSSDKTIKERKINQLKWNDKIESMQKTESKIKRKVNQTQENDKPNEFINFINQAIKQIQHPSILENITHQIHTFTDLLQKEETNLFEIKENQRYKKVALDIHIKNK